MTEMRQNGTIAFIGLDNSCASEALVAAAWNYPLITYVSNHFSIIFIIYRIVQKILTHEQPSKCARAVLFRAMTPVSEPCFVLVF